MPSATYPDAKSSATKAGPARSVKTTRTSSQGGAGGGGPGANSNNTPIRVFGAGGWAGEQKKHANGDHTVYRDGVGEAHHTQSRGITVGACPRHRGQAPRATCARTHHGGKVPSYGIRALSDHGGSAPPAVVPWKSENSTVSVIQYSSFCHAPSSVRLAINYSVTRARRPSHVCHARPASAMFPSYSNRTSVTHTHTRHTSVIQISAPGFCHKPLSTASEFCHVSVICGRFVSYFCQTLPGSVIQPSYFCQTPIGVRLLSDTLLSYASGFWHVSVTRNWLLRYFIQSRPTFVIQACVSCLCRPSSVMRPCRIRPSAVLLLP